MTNLVLSTMHSNGLIWAIQVNSNKIKWFFSLFNDKQKFSISIHSFIRKKKWSTQCGSDLFELGFNSHLSESTHKIRHPTFVFVLCCTGFGNCTLWLSSRHFIQTIYPKKKKSFTVCSWNIENSFWTDKTN